MSSASWDPRQEKTGKKVSARQRKKLSQDVEARRRDAAYERAEEAAHRYVWLLTRLRHATQYWYP